MPEQKKDYTSVALKYCKDIISGKIPACNYVKLSCQRHINDLSKQSDSDYPYRFDKALANRRCKFSEAFAHVKGKWAGQKLKLEPFQIFIQCCLFGWIKKETGKRRFRISYIELPRKNGKSTMAATDGLYMLSADGEKSSEVYSGATTEKQALEVFRPAWQMAQKSDGFKEKFKASLSGTPRNPTSIYILSDMSRFEPIVGKPGDGSSPQCAIIDEFHEANTSDQYDSMDTGMGAREQPLMDVITTAGTNTSSPCYEMHMKAVKVLDGTIQDDSFFSIIYTIDQGKDYRDFNVWIEANPNYGVSIQKDFLFQKYTETMTDVNKQNINLCKHLNVWTNAGTAWMNMTKWAACEDKTLKIEDYKGKNCYIAIDLANKIDICAKIQLFSDGVAETEREVVDPDTGEVVIKKTLKEKFVFFTKFYLPEDTVNLPGNEHYTNWQKEGLLTVTSGARTDFKFIEDDIKADNSLYPIQELAFDPREATYLINNIQEWASFECIEVNQGPTMMSEPMKELEALIYDGMIRHDGNKIFTWMMGNVIKKQGRNSGPVKYYYPTKQKDSDKIDGPVALIMGVGQAMLGGVPEESCYSKRGLFMI